MSYAVPTLKVRPGVVTAAAGLLFLTAGVQLISLIVSVVQIPTLQGILEDEVAGDEAAVEAVQTVVQIGLFVGIAISVALAVLYGVLGLLVARGKQAARITTWVFAGLGVLCTGCGLAGSAAQTAVQSQMAAQDPVEADLQREFEAAIPGWIGISTTMIKVVTLLALALAIVLLALPAAHAYFGKQELSWVPPGAGTYPPAGVYPPSGGYPPSPGYPPSGAFPPGGYPPSGAYPPSGGYPPAGPYGPPR